MKLTTNHLRVPGWSLAIGLLASSVIIGCATTDPDRPAVAGFDDAQTAADATDETPLPADSMRGAQLWADNCIRCHNIRPPRALSDKKWEIVMMHMRVRAGLTGEEQRQILKFLKAAN